MCIYISFICYTMHNISDIHYHYTQCVQRELLSVQLYMQKYKLT